MHKVNAKSFQFHTGDLVLVRSTKNTPWCVATYSHYNSKNKFFKHICNNGFCYEVGNCIPFTGFTEKFVGTHKNLMLPDKGDKIYVQHTGNNHWYKKTFIKFDNSYYSYLIETEEPMGLTQYWYNYKF